MNLAMLLHLVGMNRNSYNTLDQRHGLSFMRRELRSETGQDRYTVSHALAVATVREFISAGAAAAKAVDLVDRCFGTVDAAVHSLETGSEDGWWLNLTTYADGSWGWAGGDKGREFIATAPALNKVSINLAAVWSQMASRIGSPMRTDAELSEPASPMPVA